MSNDFLPKGQYRIKPNSLGKIPWPVLTAGYSPAIDLKNWTLKIYGEVENEMILNWEEFNNLSEFKQVADMHCVTKWSIYNMVWEGVNFYDIVKLVKPKDTATSVAFKSNDEIHYSTSIMYDNKKQLLYFPITHDERKEFKSEHSFIEGDKIYYPTCILATKANGEPLSVDHGGPMRSIIPDLYAWKGAKYCTEIEFSKNHTLGFWEIRGYADKADLFTEDRYENDIARSLKAEVYKKLNRR
jgi:DMSO/TMAO reductase YedYZ molybdopterin-dependent catalytic subunit